MLGPTHLGPKLVPAKTIFLDGVTGRPRLPTTLRVVLGCDSMAPAVPNVEGSGMPSFSQAGRNYSNRKDLAVINEAFARDRAQELRVRGAPTYKSLHEGGARLSDFKQDLGRTASISSSPRVRADGTSEKTKGDGLVFRRALQWSQVAGKQYDPDEETKAPAEKPSTRDKDKEPMKKKSDAAPRPNHFFTSTERGAPNDILVVIGKADSCAPPVGYYDAKIDLTKPIRNNKLGYIVQADRPHAPSVLAEALVHETLAKSKKEPSVHSKKDTHSQEQLRISPRTAVRLLRDKSPNVMDLSQYSSTQLSHKKPAATATPKRSQEDEDEKGKADDSAAEQNVDMSVVASPEANVRPRTTTPTSGQRMPIDKSWDKRSMTIDFKGRVPRKKESGASTTTGFLMDVSGSAADVWYRPSTEWATMAINNRHTPTPHLKHSGKDFDNQILRLGQRLPEDLADGPQYDKVSGAMNWSNPPAWFKATHVLDNKTSVKMSRQVPRRDLAVEGIDTGLALQFRRPRDTVRGPLNTIMPTDKNPMFGHVPATNLKKGQGHGEIAAVRSITTHLNYNPSHRLQSARTQGALHFKKMTARRPLTADVFSGKPVYTVSDTIYDTQQAFERTRPRSRSTVDMYKNVGREGWDGSEGGSAAEHLTGIAYWDGVNAHTHSLKNIETSLMPDLGRVQGREAYNPLDVAERQARYLSATIDSRVQEPISDAGKQSGGVWHPKDNVLSRHIRTPNLEENQRGADEARIKKHGTGLTQNLNYHVDDSILRPRVQTPILSNKPFNSLRDELA